ncbi:inorganic phosphate transporter [Paucihalobacter sp.]|uniref:inorganic phosphate transporter n=1 Tax=Paucihalobacter sp. TaxID=2850405 RepID=UPI002FDF1BF2
MIVLLIIAVFFLAYSNGANDNFKGVATLFGSQTCSYKTALIWATVTTFLGGLAAIFFAQQLMSNFSGKGILDDALIQLPTFGVSIAMGAAITVYIATKIGMPISTTHALVGALTGLGLIANTNNGFFNSIMILFLLPLFVGPILASVLSFVMYKIFNYVRMQTSITKDYCICINEKTQEFLYYQETEKCAAITKNPIISSCTVSEQYSGKLLGITAQHIIRLLHFFSAGLVSFARGLNDTPKIAAILLITTNTNTSLSLVAIAVAMSIGGILNAKKVGVNMSKNITSINEGQGFTANLVTGFLTTTASVFGLPVSTTHASVGAIFGISFANKKSNIRTTYKIVSSWLITLPMAAFVAVIVYIILNLFF